MSAAQLQAVRVLTGIIRRAEESGLPSLTWNVHPYDGAGLLGQPFGGDDDTRGAVLAAWADHLGVKATTTREPSYVAIEVRAEVDGVPVRIFTHTDREAGR